jgi:tetratricopeptide (TPR) repeat protein
VSSLLEIARALEWDFPSSAGRPMRDPARAEPLLSRRGELVSAARELGDSEATELGARVWRVWMAARHIDGGRAFLASVLERADASRWRALALYGDGLFAWWQGDRDASHRRNDAALALADDPEAITLASVGLCRLALDEGDHGRALELARDARRHASQVSDALGQSPLHLEAQARRLAGDFDAAAELFEESLELNGRIDDPSMVDVELHNLSNVELRRGDADAAERYFAELPPATEPYDVAMARLNEAWVAWLRGDAARARRVLDAIGPIELATDDRADLVWLQDQLA